MFQITNSIYNQAAICSAQQVQLYYYYPALKASESHSLLMTEHRR